MDCREIEDVSVLLLSTMGAVMKLGVADDCIDGDPECVGWAVPVINSLLKPSTSRDCLAAPDPALSGAVRLDVYSRGSAVILEEGSIVAMVFENGLGGIVLGVDAGGCPVTADDLPGSVMPSSSLSMSPAPSKLLSNTSSKLLSSTSSGKVPGRVGGGVPSRSGRSLCWKASLPSWWTAGCGGDAVGDSMRTDFFVLAAGGDETRTKILLFLIL